MTWSSSNIICPRTAGFGYRFASLASATKRLVDADNRAATTADGDSDGDSELAAAFGVIFSTARRFRVMTVLQVWFPLLRRFVSRGRLYHPIASSLCPGAVYGRSLARFCGLAVRLG